MTLTTLIVLMLMLLLLLQLFILLCSDSSDCCSLDDNNSQASTSSPLLLRQDKVTGVTINPKKIEKYKTKLKLYIYHIVCLLFALMMTQKDQELQVWSRPEIVLLMLSYKQMRLGDTVATKLEMETSYGFKPKRRKRMQLPFDSKRIREKICKVNLMIVIADDIKLSPSQWWIWEREVYKIRRYQSDRY